MTDTIELDAVFPAQDYVTIGGDKSPGKSVIFDVHTPRPWDIRKGYALTGATIVPQGDDLGTFKIRFEFWSGADVPAWYAFAAKYFDKSVRLVPGSNKPKALSILHPMLSAPPVRITACVVDDATGLEPDDDGLGGYHATVSFIQYRAPKPALSPPDAAIPPAANPQPTAEDAADQEIQNKQATYQSLASQ
jgi:hypothetical protein